MSDWRRPPLVIGCRPRLKIASGYLAAEARWICLLHHMHIQPKVGRCGLLRDALQNGTLSLRADLAVQVGDHVFDVSGVARRCVSDAYVQSLPSPMAHFKLRTPRF